jgi:UDP-N-acetylglucosamine acyltransferase
MTDISPHAVVACPANLAKGVTVGAFSFIGPNVRVGAGSRIDNNAVIDGDVEIGPDNHIYPFALIGADGATGRVRIGRGNQIREHVVICAAPAPGETRVGDFTLLSTGSYVGAGSRVDDRVVLGTYSQLSENTHLEEHVWASAFTGTERDVTIGRYSFTSGFAGIDHDAPPFAMLQGFPFRIRGVNTHNLKRCGFSDEAIEALKDIFRSLFNGADHGVVPGRLGEWAARTDLDANQRYLIDFLVRAGYDGPPGHNSGKGAC